jgi:hypothetical protein
MTIAKTTIRKQDGEYAVRLHIDGVFQKEATYYTDDKEDAEATAEAMKMHAEKVTAYDNGLARAWDTYDKEADRLAESAYTYHVVPYCEKHGYTFCAGMGDWVFSKDGHTVDLDTGRWLNSKTLSWCEGTGEEPDDETRALLDLLHLEVPGLPMGDFGSIMPCYPREVR